MLLNYNFHWKTALLNGKIDSGSKGGAPKKQSEVSPDLRLINTHWMRMVNFGDDTQWVPKVKLK